MIIATLFLLVLSGTARAEIFTAYLAPEQEVPPAASTAKGWARITVNQAAGTLSFIVFFEGLTSNQTASHIHAPAPIGTNAGVQINFGAVGGTTGTITGTASITPTQLSQLRQGLGYVNVHTTNIPGGEIRGQLAKSRPVDIDGDGRTDMSMLRFPNIAPPGVSPITWWNRLSFDGSTQIVNPWGDANRDFPAPGDWDGDAKTDVAIYRDGAVAGAQSEFWILQSSTNTVRYFAWGLFGDEPIQRDYDGDGITDAAIFRRGATATTQTGWYIRNSATGTVTVAGFGLTGNGTTSADFPIPGDYDGDGRFDIAVYRFGQAPANTYIIWRSSDGVITYQAFGNFNTDYILPGDYDGDGRFDLALARVGATGTSPLVWWILQSSNGVARVKVFGRSSDVPVQGDYDGDSRTDIAIVREGATATAQSFFWVDNSLTGTSTVTPWGIGSDFPTNSYDSR